MANPVLLSDALPARRGDRRPGRAFGCARTWHLWLAALVALALLPPAAAAAPLAGPERLDTTVADFAACPVPAGLIVADEAGGELRRAAALEDYFNDPLSSGRWSWGSWTGATYSPAPSGGALAVASTAGSAWLRSAQPFSQRVLSTRATLGAGPWQHVGWGGNGFRDRWAIVSTADAGTTVFARTFDGGIELRTALAGVSPGVAHDYRVAWGPTQVEYYVDGALAALHPVAIGNAMYAYASNNGAAGLSIDFLRVESYAAGSVAYESCTKDAGAVGAWGQLTWAGQTPAGAGLALETRSSVDGLSWSGWTAVSASGGQVQSPVGRYLQYRATLTSSATDSPRLDEVAYTTAADAAAATPTSAATPSLTATPSGTLTSAPSLTATPSGALTATPTRTGTPVAADTTPPAITNVQATLVTGTGATITWTTDEPADGLVEYGQSATPLNGALTTAHSQPLTGLAPGTTYSYRVKSKDVAGNLAASATLTFSTSANTPTQTATATPSPTATPSATATVASGGPAPVWAVVAPPSLVRFDQSATLLPNGKVLVAGGCCVGGGGLPLPSAELYDPAADAWTPTGSLAGGRQWHSATLLPSGKVLIAGGCCGPGYWLETAELYDPATGSWSPTGSMAVAHAEHTATLLPNGKVLVVGGDWVETAELYDPATGSWSPAGSMAVQRANHTATLLPNGKVLVVGGCCATTNAAAFGTADLYDPATGGWSPTGSPAVGRAFHTATLLPNGKVLVAGGAGPNFEGLDSAELYDPATGTWSPTGGMAVGRLRQTATLLPGGRVLVAGGSSLTSTELYDPASGSWSPAASQVRAHNRSLATLLAGGEVLVAGEETNSTSAEVYGRPVSSADATRTDTTLADFGTCGVGAGLVALSDEAGGELRLPAALEEYFTGPLSKTRWSWGTWEGAAYSPAPAGGALAMQSSAGTPWLRSSSGFIRRTLEGRVAFGAAWQHVGWGDATLSGRYALLSTYDGTGLYVRTADGAGEQRTRLSVPASGYHDVRVAWGDSAVEYYVDGALVATHNLSSAVPLYAWASGGSASGPLQLEWLRAASYTPGSATQVSCVKDARAFGASGAWSRLSWAGQVPAGTSLLLETRSSTDGASWSAWGAVATSGGPIGSPPGRFLQYRATLTASATASPRLDQVRFTTLPGGPIP